MEVRGEQGMEGWRLEREQGRDEGMEGWTVKRMAVEREDGMEGWKVEREVRSKEGGVIYRSNKITIFFSLSLKFCARL